MMKKRDRNFETKKWNGVYCMQLYIEDLEKIRNSIGEKEAKRLSIPILIRLLTKLREKEIEDEHMRTLIEGMLNFLAHEAEGRRYEINAYKKEMKLLLNYAKKTYGMIAKDTYIGMGIAMGVAFGAGLGSAYASINPGFMGMGGAGIAIGLAIGVSLEEKANKEGKLY